MSCAGTHAAGAAACVWRVAGGADEQADSTSRGIMAGRHGDENVRRRWLDMAGLVRWLRALMRVSRSGRERHASSRCR
ncbi:MAG: hypothetical protein ABS82_11470 [Rhodanobacter sp. SCN 67-45]|nr:MAG: hypothetical protein ABS82_11470 [Rhodanobacter sp. SCN 67-45]